MGKVKINNTVPDTHVLIVLDASGSMGVLSRNVVDCFNSEIEALRKAAATVSGQTFVSVYSFDYSQHCAAKHVPLGDIPVLGYGDYTTSGGTALYKTLTSVTRDNSPAPGEANLLMLITDGFDTEGGSNFWATQYKALNKDKWTFVLRGPHGSKGRLWPYFPANNCQEWQGGREYQEASVRTQAAFSGYYAARGSGETTTQCFYKPDLSKVKGSDLRFLLQEVDGQYRKYAVDRECAINAFVEYKTGRGYVPGSTYYQLTKPEDIEQGRNLLLRHRDTGTLYGGPNVRNVVSMPSVGIVKAKPGNMGEYDLFIESHSLNRRLVRGTDIYVKK